MSTPFAAVVEAAAQASATRSRLAKVRALVDVLSACEPDDLAIVVGFLTGEPRQRRLGVGWGSLDAFSRDEGSTAEVSSLSVGEVDTVFATLAVTTGAGSVASRNEQLTQLRARATADEWDFLCRLLLGDLRIGALGGIVLEAIASSFSVPVVAVRRAHLLTGDLAQTATISRTGVLALEAVELVVLRPVQSMLAATSASVVDAVRELGHCSIEWKLDGARIQVHRQGNDVLIVTRNLNDVTDRLPEVASLVRSLPVRSVVLDGEVLRMRTDGRPESFQDTMSRFGTGEETVSAAGEDGPALRPYFFDCMHLDGVDLLDRPLHERAAALVAAVGAHRVPALVTDDPDVAERFAADALARGHEGVMVKAIDSTYEAGRRGSTWRKVKPVKTLDLVVLGAEWGHGRRQGWLSNLHLGARADDGSGFVMVGKTFKGLTDAVLASQTIELLARETERRGITVFVRPELVVEIALDGAQRSSRYPGGVALRFARVRHYRPDRSADTADLLSSIHALLT